MTEPRADWWAAIWCGLVVDREGKHVRRLGAAIYLFLYLVLHARRESGIVISRQGTISRRMGVPLRTVQRWLATLRHWQYVEIVTLRPVLQLRIARWKSARARRQI